MFVCVCVSSVGRERERKTDPCLCVDIKHLFSHHVSMAADWDSGLDFFFFWAMVKAHMLDIISPFYTCSMTEDS